MKREKKPRRNLSELFSFRLDKGTSLALTAAANERQRSKANLLNLILVEWLQREDYLDQTGKLSGRFHTVNPGDIFWIEQTPSGAKRITVQNTLSSKDKTRK